MKWSQIVDNVAAAAGCCCCLFVAAAAAFDVISVLSHHSLEYLWGLKIFSENLHTFSSVASERLNPLFVCMCWGVSLHLIKCNIFRQKIESIFKFVPPNCSN